MLDLEIYSDQLKSFRASDEARDRLIADLIQKLKILTDEHSNITSDYKSERDNRRKYQREIEEKQREVVRIRRELESSSFVLALIDGDGAIFQDALLKAANGNGGSEAASTLHQAIRKHISSIHSDSENWPIMVQIYLSLDKLAAKLAQVGLLRSSQDFRIFVQKFSVNQPLYSIIDVGQGKERADHKIKEMLRTFSDNPTCRHILFGGCHDAGYLLNLDQFKHDEFKAGRITLLETTPAHRGFGDLPNFKRACFDDVFRSQPLPDAVMAAPSAASPVAPSPALPQITSSAQVPTRPTPFRAGTNNSSSGSSPQPSIVSLAPSTPSSSAEATHVQTWAAVGRSRASTDTISIAPTAPNHDGKKKWMYFNKASMRLDEPLPPRDPKGAASLEARMHKTGKKVCNHWHLSGHCDNGKFCHFQHEPKLSPTETVALRYKARSSPCRSKYCENFACYLGHQCVNERDNGRCPFGESCHFRDTHGMDKIRHVRVDEAGNEEYAP